MNDHDQYSDEHISAYIDGELDYEERAHLLYDEQEDTGLAKRINDARILKEKVNLAYSDILNKNNPSKHFSCSQFVKQRRSLVAGLFILVASTALLLPVIISNSDDDITIAIQLIKNTPAVTANKIDHSIGSHKKTIINVSRYQPQNFNAVIDNIESVLLKNNKDKSFHIEIVASKAGLRLLDSDTSLHAERITSLVKKFDNVKIVACAKSLAKLASEGDPIQLIKAITITPSVAQQVAKRTSEGWLYLSI